MDLKNGRDTIFGPDIKAFVTDCKINIGCLLMIFQIYPFLIKKKTRKAL